jgi:hypothetical protein
MIENVSFLAWETTASKTATARTHTCKQRMFYPFMRAAALFAVAPLLATASFMKMEFPKVNVSSDLSCDACQLVVGTLGAIAGNQTSLTALLAGLDAGCEAVFANDTLAMAACELVADVAVKALPTIAKDVEELAWDPIAVCATFIPVCTMPCCDTNTTPEQVRQLPGACCGTYGDVMCVFVPCVSFARLLPLTLAVAPCVCVVQLHLSFSEAGPSAMVITWTTLLATSTNTVQWGLASAGQNPNALPFSATGSNRTYTWSGWIGVVHEATMVNLAPGTTYTYRVGDADGGWSDLFNFTTLPLNAGTAARPLRVVQIGDMGYGNASDQTVATVAQWVREGLVDFIAHVGEWRCHAFVLLAHELRDLVYVNPAFRRCWLR